MLHVHVWSKWDLKCQSFTKLIFCFQLMFSSECIMKCKLDSYSVLLRDKQVETYEQEDSRHVNCAVIYIWHGLNMDIYDQEDSTLCTSRQYLNRKQSTCSLPVGLHENQARTPVLTCVLTPKSQSFTWPWVLTRILEGLISETVYRQVKNTTLPMTFT